MLNQRNDIEQTRCEVAIAGLPPAFDGFRIVHLTDLHYGRKVPLDLVTRAVNAANELAPDLVVLTGDYITGHIQYLAPCAGELARFGKTRVIAVLGNHDRWIDAEAVANALTGVGIEVLANEHTMVQRDGAQLAIVGVDDLWTGPADLDAALDGLDGRATRILLTHNPDLIEEMPDRRIALAFAGHTHGGQIALPFLRCIAVPSRYGTKYAAGLVQGPTTRVYVGRGVGTVGPPIRINCRPEVALITLTSGQRFRVQVGLDRIPTDSHPWALLKFSVFSCSRNDTGRVFVGDRREGIARNTGGCLRATRRSSSGR